MEQQYEKTGARIPRWTGVGFFILAALLIGVLLLWGFLTPKEEESRKKYSVILYQYTDYTWESFTQGIRQAQEDFKVEVNLVTMAKEAGAQEQQSLIERELKNGAQGLLVAAVNSQALQDRLIAVSKEVPVVTVETGVGEEVPHVGADDYQMGYRLGEKLQEDFSGKEVLQVAVVREYWERNSVRERYEGLKAALEDGQVPVQITDWNRGAGDYDLALYLKKQMGEWYQDAAVTLDKYTTEQLIEGHKLYRSELVPAGNGRIAQPGPALYGIGNTNYIVNALDRGEIQALVYQNEFNAGYQGVQQLVEGGKKSKKKSPVIQSYLVEKETLYETENQRLLFPIL